MNKKDSYHCLGNPFALSYPITLTSSKKTVIIETTVLTKCKWGSSEVQIPSILVQTTKNYGKGY